MKIAIHQPSYFAWLGYFHKIYWSDIFIYHDDIPSGHGKKFSNRVQVNDNGMARWLTVPLKKHNPETRLYELEINNSPFSIQEHWNKIRSYYRGAKYFNELFLELRDIFEECGGMKTLTDCNVLITERILQMLYLDRQTIKASDLDIKSTDKREVIIEIIQKCNGTEYLSGTGAKEFQSDNIYTDAGIELIYQDTSDFNKFSILDSLFNVGIAGTQKLLQ